VKALRAVLPAGAALLAVGGVSTENMALYRAAGVQGFGVGTALFEPGDSPELCAQRAERLLAAARG
jgi:2-dehydro-3-deoxyphosphogalactonate aldolase